MKKREFAPFLLLFALFFCFCVGLFFGRNLFSNTDPVRMPEMQSMDVSAPVDINRADSRVLTTLPGIGPSLARQIVQYRNAHGPFTSLTQLLHVEGIGPERLEALLPYITTGG